MKKIKPSLLKLLAMVIAVCCLVSCSNTNGNNTSKEESSKEETEVIVEADKVIIGNIYTGDENLETAEAMAEKDGIIIYVGDEEGVKAYIGENTEVTEYRSGELITAGLCDGHTHVSEYLVAAFNNLCRIPDGATSDDCVEIISQYITDYPDVDFVVASGWNNSAFGDLGPTADLLDAIDTDKPILAYSADGHSYWFNTILLNMAGLTKDTVTPEGGDIMRYEDGTPSGCTKDTANAIIDAVKPDKDDQVYYDGLWGAENLNVREGYVARFQAGDNESSDPYQTPFIDHSETMDQNGEMYTYTQGSFQINDTEDALELVDKAIEIRDKTKGGNYEVTTVKIFMDGIIENEGAYLSEPYSNNAENSGKPRWVGEDALVRLGHIIAKANENGMNVHFHTMGDQAVSDALTAIGYAADEIGIDKVRESRNALVHLALVGDEDYERFAKYNVVAVLNPWCYKDPSFYDQQVEYLGNERAANQYPMQSFLDAGVHIAFGTDLGASFTYNSIECFHALATRTYKDDVPSTLLKESEKLSRIAVLDAMTSGVAYQMGKEDSMGTITVGKLANATVFSQNILTITDAEIMDTKVIGCLSQGEWLEFVPWDQL